MLDKINLSQTMLLIFKIAQYELKWSIIICFAPHRFTYVYITVRFVNLV